MTDYRWQPISPLSDDDREIDLGSMRPLYDIWRVLKSRLETDSPNNLRKFSQSLVRRLSIETGILERIYDLDRGTTEALVANGFVEDLVSRSSTDIEPSRLIDILRDHEAAIGLVMDCVAGNRNLTKSVVHELHMILTQHQDTTEAIDLSGKRLKIKLLKGRFKEQINNPKRPDGSVHEYCPPIQVDSEMENLIRWLGEYANEDPIIVAAWFHHRFTQIHPYQDGNGRVARSLTTLILLRANLLPLVVDRDLRAEYIDTLEIADQRDLSAIARLFARLERAAILQALSVDSDAEITHQKTLASAVIESLRDKFDRRRQQQLSERRTVNEVALTLRTYACSHLSEELRKLETVISVVSRSEIQIVEEGSDRGSGHWYKFQVARSATEAHTFANFGEYHYFVKASVRAEKERLVFVTSFHHVGKELTGIMEATAFARLESFEDSEDREFVSEAFFPCSLEPFVFTYKTIAKGVEQAFVRWLDTALAVAIKVYGDRL